MKKLAILPLLTVLTGLTAGLQAPQMSMIEKPNVNTPSDFEPSEKPDVDPGFETDLTYSYESDLVDFNTSESVEADPKGLENISGPEEETGENNETAGQPEEPPQNETDNENDEDTSYSSGSGGGDYSTPSIKVETAEDNPKTNETNETEPKSSGSDKNTEETEERTQPGIFEGVWAETGDSSPSLHERLTGRFSQSETIGSISIILIGAAIVYLYD